MPLVAIVAPLENNGFMTVTAQSASPWAMPHAIEVGLTLPFLRKLIFPPIRK